MFCALLGQDIRLAFTGPLVLWLRFRKYMDSTIYVAKTKALISCMVTTNQLQGYRAADLRLCFHIRKMQIFS